uniref:ALA-interacting subunit n=1 Tax=Neobodo designis TaxID=312471 RepID=A0A7S1W573_NEODS|mmetsp:Transcript_52886/g.162808  ORF Transcript_52886/g.162808 Transcript_52886/m.162808 type:complete len:401 (+) Transcript_52886:141-1343(+)|eukprot:CAMPEP_0174839118 /NCGR_PEP_ID=MMETSP1114-20130205/7843_1 /TAXON_ID=312471 /ORGANISM="Neobodo designis, Strain CCAP 1951/1" /LENGTH=400 /DNA_ID=CAMNT_0016073239 /DNA_START=137 /DNA_END=1339 /DNA_ORIENTATION=+
MADLHHHEPKKENKPSNSNFRQQRLVAWQPIMSPPHVVACLMVVAVCFLPVGVVILMANNDALNVEFRYDTVRQCSLSSNDGLATYDPGNGEPVQRQGCRTVVNFTVSEKMAAPVYMYYKLTNFYQNHRRFAKSRSVSQLAGNDPGKSSMSDCDPLLDPGAATSQTGTPVTVDGQTTTYGAMKYSPCGLVAWSLFNDTFGLVKYTNNGFTAQVICNGSRFDKATAAPLPGAGNCTKKGITWESDADKFKTPEFGNTIWTANRAHYGLAPTPTADDFVRNGWYAGEALHEVPVVTDEDLQVWMRTAALPTFRKLYRVINVDLEPGDYAMVIDEFFPVDSFGGSKSFALSTLSWLGGKNTFLAVAYIVVGAVSFVLGAVFFVVYKANGDRMQAAIDSLSELQ